MFCISKKSIHAKYHFSQINLERRTSASKKKTHTHTLTPQITSEEERNEKKKKQARSAHTNCNHTHLNCVICVAHILNSLDREERAEKKTLFKRITQTKKRLLYY